MGKLLSRNAAIAYLRESCGSMSMKVFMNEVHAGRIPAKPYGCLLYTSDAADD